jgi:hypothetical protein
MKDIKRISLGLLLLAITIGACVKDPKDIPPGITEAPDFGMSAHFGNTPVNIEAGTNQWTMIPIVEHQDSLDVYTAVFSKDGCLEQCPSSWKFRFYQALPDNIDPIVDFAGTIHAGEKELVLSDQELDSFDIHLSTHPGLFMSGFSFWEDIDGQPTYFHEYQTLLGYQDSLSVCFQSLAYTGCIYTQCIDFDPSTGKPCIISIEPKLEPQANQTYVSLSVRPEGTPPFKYQWFNEASTPSIVVPVRDNTDELYVGVIVTDALGNRADLVQTIRLQDTIIDPCYFPISLTSSIVDNTLASHFADRVEITYTDDAGIEWRSRGGIQPENSLVIIDAVSGYGLSPLGQETSLVDGRIKALLFNAQTGESKWFETTRLSIALSHP